MSNGLMKARNIKETILKTPIGKWKVLQAKSTLLNAMKTAFGRVVALDLALEADVSI